MWQPRVSISVRFSGGLITSNMSEAISGAAQSAVTAVGQINSNSIVEESVALVAQHGGRTSPEMRACDGYVNATRGCC